MRSIVVPTVADLMAGGRREAVAIAIVAGAMAAADALEKDPTISDDKLKEIDDAAFDAAFDAEAQKVMEADRRAIFPVPTIAEVIALGYDGKDAPDIVLGGLSRYSLLRGVPSTAAVIALGFDDKRAFDIMQDLVAEKAFEERWGCNDDALVARLRGLVPEPIPATARLEGISDYSGPLKLLDLMRRQMEITLALSGHVADETVQAWRRDLGELEAGLRGDEEEDEDAGD